MVEDRKRSRVQNALLNIMFILVSAFCVLPILYILSASFNSTMALAEHGYTLIPREFTLEAYEYVMKAPKQLLSAYGVTITVTVIGTVISLLLTSMLAYVLARKDFKWRFAISFYVLIVCLFSGGTVGSYLINTRVSVWNVFHIFQASAGFGEGGLADQFLQMVVFAGIPFRIHQQPQPVLKGHVPELRV